MAPDLDDLLPLFLREARDRLERLATTADRIESEEEAARAARKELHALKGASRMMRLGEVAELCHRAEDCLNPVRAGSRAEVVELLDHIARRLEALEAGPPTRAPGEEAESGEPVVAVGAAQLRVPTAVLDGLADGAVQLRILAGAAEELMGVLLRLAHLAESGAGEREPRQVLATIAPTLRHAASRFEEGQRRMRRIVEGQLDTLVHLQVQPVLPFLLTLARHGRELARSLGKDTEVTVEAADTQLDRRIMETLEESFLHLVRNAVDHGVEPPAERAAAGKPERGHVRLTARAEGDRVRIVVADDGGGIDPERVRSTAVRRGLLTADDAARLGTKQVLQLLFAPGFSTRDLATEVSGRGIGLDAVATEVHGIGGDLWLESAPGIGSTVTLELPLARRGERVLIVRVGGHRLALPAGFATGFRQAGGDGVMVEDGRTLVEVDGRPHEVRSLARLTGEEATDERVLVEGRVGGTRLVLGVTAVEGEEEVLVRPLPRSAPAGPLIESVALLASGVPVPVIAPHRLTRVRGLHRGRREAVPARRLTVLLADDSVVTRSMLRWLLEEGGFAVTAVGTAEEALQLLSERAFDCLVTDIEMPGMDGLELTRRLRTLPHLAQLPVVAVSTRDRPEDRMAGLAAGADAYVSKQGLEARELTALVRRLGEGT